MNESNAYFDKMLAKLNKENQGINVGRLVGQRPSTAVQNWRPKDPFVTYEMAALTKAEEQELEQKRLINKIRNDRIQVYN